MYTANWEVGLPRNFEPSSGQEYENIFMPHHSPETILSMKLTARNKILDAGKSETSHISDCSYWYEKNISLYLLITARSTRVRVHSFEGTGHGYIVSQYPSHSHTHRPSRTHWQWLTVTVTDSQSHTHWLTVWLWVTVIESEWLSHSLTDWATHWLTPSVKVSVTETDLRVWLISDQFLFSD